MVATNVGAGGADQHRNVSLESLDGLVPNGTKYCDALQDYSSCVIVQGIHVAINVVAGAPQLLVRQ